MKSRVGAAIVVLPETFDFECLHVATALENIAPLDVEKKSRCRPGSVDASPAVAVVAVHGRCYMRHVVRSEASA